MANIANIAARPILDSRGTWTIEVALTLGDRRRVVASVPQGKSTGSHEAHAVSAAQAVRNIEKLVNPSLKGKNPLNQKAIDELLIRRDGTPLKKKLGANAMLGVSIAVLRAGAVARHIPLWSHARLLSGLSVPKKRFPRLYMNMINGGLHAGNNLDFQEYLVIPKAKTVAESISIGTAIYRALGASLVKTKGKGATNIGDEGGYAPNFKNNLEPFVILKKVVQSLGFKNKVDFGLDAAASGVLLQNNRPIALYARMQKEFNLLYLEDPFGEEQFDEFAKLRTTLNARTLIAGDDLTTTNTVRMHRAYKSGSINAIIIKPNQIGTVSEALEAVRLARKYSWAVVASHRSGETNDDFIADFAYGVGADGLKLGGPARGERIAKYNRLLEIERG